jgi:hypothetical protein
MMGLSRKSLNRLLRAGMWVMEENCALMLTNKPALMSRFLFNLLRDCRRPFNPLLLR